MSTPDQNMNLLKEFQENAKTYIVDGDAEALDSIALLVNEMQSVDCVSAFQYTDLLKVHHLPPWPKRLFQERKKSSFLKKVRAIIINHAVRLFQDKHPDSLLAGVTSDSGKADRAEFIRVFNEKIWDQHFS